MSGWGDAARDEVVGGRAGDGADAPLDEPSERDRQGERIARPLVAEPVEQSADEQHALVDGSVRVGL
jgi:hypothetical protein